MLGGLGAAGRKFAGSTAMLFSRSAGHASAIHNNSRERQRIERRGTHADGVRGSTG